MKNWERRIRDKANRGSGEGAKRRIADTPRHSYAGTSPHPYPGVRKYPNGDIQCTGWNDRIDMAVCITRSIRHPGKCANCAIRIAEKEDKTWKDRQS